VASTAAYLSTDALLIVLLLRLSRPPSLDPAAVTVSGAAS